MLCAALLLVSQAAPKTPAKVVIDYTGASTRQAAHLVSSVRNLLKALPKTKVEIVCHDGGIALLTQPGLMRDDAKRLHLKGVRFAVCQNSLRNLHVNPKAVPTWSSVVPAGIAELVQKQGEGWAYLKAE
jgi:intracellular sulfur oxidation DsrE/DsrF family protein